MPYHVPMTKRVLFLDVSFRSSSKKFVNAAIELGISGVRLDKNHLLLDELKILAKEPSK